MSLLRSPLSLPMGLFVLATGIVQAYALSGSNTKDQEKAGAVLFRDKGCAFCHGAAAQGTQRGPSLANVRKTMNAAKIAGQIENGGLKMPSFKDAVSSDELAQLIAFLRARHRPTPAPVPAGPQTSAPVSNPGQ